MECEYQDLQGAIDNLQLFTWQMDPRSSHSQTDTTTTTSSVRSRSPGGISAQSQKAAAISTAPPALNLTDLGLLHHFTTQTYSTIGPLQRDHSAWQTEIPRLALAYPFLMHAILGLAAAHQMSLGSATSTTDLCHTAREHYDSALRLFQESFLGPTSGELGSVFLGYGILTCVLHLSLGCEQAREKEPIDGFIHLVNLLQMNRKVMQEHGQSAQSTVLHKFVTQEVCPDSSQSPSNPELDVELLRLAAVVSSYAGSILDPAEAQALNTAYASLHGHYRRMGTTPKTGGGLLIWPFQLAPEFGILLSRRDPVALCLLSHWCVSICNAPYKWYVGDWQDRLMMAICARLQGTLWEEHIQWQLRETRLPRGNELLKKSSRDRLMS